jgi:drug/metabolite transporter (DMT)-like permease
VKGYLFVLGAALLWASSATLGKSLFAEGITPIELAQVRSLFGSLGLALALAVLSRDRLRVRARDLPWLLLLGGVVMALVQLAYFFAIEAIQVAAAILIQYTSPVLVVVFSALLLKDRFTAAKLAALALALGGCFLVVGGLETSLADLNLRGLAWGVTASVAFAVYTLLGERLMHRYSPWTVLLYTLLFAALTCHAIDPSFDYVTEGRNPGQWARMAYVAILGTAVPFGLYFAGIDHIRASRASITATTEPLFAGAIAFFVLGETLGPLQILGGALVVGAVVLLQLKREREDGAPRGIREQNRA